MKFLTALFAILCLTCNPDTSSEAVTRDTVHIVPLDTPINVESEGWIPNREVLLRPVFESIEKQKEEMLPFDEPLTEEGQQDGSLRPAWIQAYYTHKSVYEFNGDKYRTMLGHPHIPQVCADFIVDTIDRAGGTWYNNSLRYPTRIVGNVDIRSDILNLDLSPRRVEDLIVYMRARPSQFEFVFDAKGPKIGNRKTLDEFFEFFEVQKGDIVFIKGRAKWDNYREDHSHSFFITGFDEKGRVSKVTGNPVYPVERSLAVERNRTPRRHVMQIIRLTDDFLLKINNGI
jgi:hypothetical protein